MRQENKNMQKFLEANGIKAKVKFIRTGSLKNTWRILNPEIKWYDNVELQKKLDYLGFKDFDGKKLNNYSGNAGIFSVFAINEQKTKEFTWRIVTLNTKRKDDLG